MLGAFLWGRRSKTNLISFQQKMGIKLEAMTEYNGIIHHRRYQYADGVLKIWDSFTGANGKNKEQILLLNPTAVLEKGPKGILIKTPNSQVLILNSSKQISKINNYIYSASYTYATEGKRIEFCSIKNTLALEIQILERKHEGKMCV